MQYLLTLKRSRILLNRLKAGKYTEFLFFFCGGTRVAIIKKEKRMSNKYQLLSKIYGSEFFSNSVITFFDLKIFYKLSEKDMF